MNIEPAQELAKATLPESSIGAPFGGDAPETRADIGDAADGMVENVVAAKKPRYRAKPKFVFPLPLKAVLLDLDGTVGIARLAKDSGVGASELTRAFIAIGTALGLDWAQHTAERMSPSDPWERLLINGLARDFQHMRIDFLRRHGGRRIEPMAAVERWAEAQDPAIRQFRAMVTRAQAAVPVAPAMLAQIASQARNLLGR